MSISLCYYYSEQKKTFPSLKTVFIVSQCEMTIVSLIGVLVGVSDSISWPGTESFLAHTVLLKSSATHCFLKL